MKKFREFVNENIVAIDIAECYTTDDIIATMLPFTDDMMSNVDTIQEGIIKSSFKLPDNFNIRDYNKDNIHSLNMEYYYLNILFYISVLDKRKGFTEKDGKILINLARANTKELIERTINHEIIHRVQLAKSENKFNIDKIKDYFNSKGINPLTKKELDYIQYFNYFELMAYAYTFVDSAIENGYTLREILKIKDNYLFNKLLKYKQFKKYLYWYYEDINKNKKEN